MSASPSKVGSPASRFCDYFIICGLDYSSGLEVLQSYLVDGINELANCTPLERSYKPKILAHYPENVPWNPFDQEAVRNLSLPSGLIFRTQKHLLEPCFHSFVITRENGSRTFGFSYVFYEEVRSKLITSAIQTLQAMHLTELSSAKNHHDRRSHHPRGIKKDADALHQSVYQSSCGTSPSGNPGLRQRNRAQYLAATEENNTRSLPRHFKLAAHKQSLNASAQNFYDASKDILYITKAIALICPLPYVHAARSFLTQLYRSSQSTNREFSLESYVYNFLYHVPLPPPGRTVKFKCFDESITCTRPKTNELPLLDYFMGDLFGLLDLESVLQLFTCVLLENQILLYSKDIYRLMVVAECITSLLFPFLWPHVYVPILPSTLHHFLDAPVPFIMGLHAQTTECKENIPCEANLCFVDIDNNRVQVPEDLPMFPQKSNLIEELLEILKKFNIPLQNVSKSTNNHSSPYRMRRGRGRKNSWSHDSDSGMSSNEESLSLTDSHAIHNTKDSLLPNSNHRTSVVTNPVFADKEELKFDELILKNLKLNNSVREIFFNRFVHIFSSYDHFVVQPDQDTGRLLIHNFDKATFLSDQPDQHLPFLSRFIETQMFASLIDRKISTMTGEADPNLSIFEYRIKLLRNMYGECLVRTPSYEPCVTIKETEEMLEKRFINPDITAPAPLEVCNYDINDDTNSSQGNFPILNKVLLNISPTDTRNTRLLRKASTAEILPAEVSLITTNNEYPSLRSVFVPNQTSSSPASIAQANWEFVKQLLQECKSRTKRMLVEKMGAEAVALGHGEISLVGLEENTLVAGLCDLLERIWAHGLHVKQKGKSPLWNFLMNYQESEACKDSSKPIDPQFLTPALAWCILRKRLDTKILTANKRNMLSKEKRITLPSLVLSMKTGNLSTIGNYFSQAKFDLSARAMDLNINVPTTGKSKDPNRKTPEKQESQIRSRTRSVELPVLKPIPVSIAFDMRNIQGITEIKTEIGYARAWIRLSLEKKVLSKHLRALLSDDELLRGFYRRTAFLRSEEEKEQFLYHLLTLNAVDYFCFTNTYTNIGLPYRVLIYPSRKCYTSANVWITVSGTLNETAVISIPNNTLDFSFQHKNLGLLLTLNIGHDNSGLSPKWMVDYVIVRNEVTGHTTKYDIEYKMFMLLAMFETEISPRFQCGRWLGKDVDDGSSERLLVGEPCYEQDSLSEHRRLKTPPRARSPSIPRYDTRMNISDIQQFLGDSVNSIVKHYYKPDRDKGSMTVLLCGEKGLVSAMELVFQYGFKSSRFFSKNYIWDYFCKNLFSKLQTELTEEFGHLEQMDEGEYFHEQVEAVRSYVSFVQKISSYADNLGKEGKFQLFICLCLREHLLHRLPAQLSSCPVTGEMYEKYSFLRDPDLIAWLLNVLEALDDFDIVLEHSLTKGIE